MHYIPKISDYQKLLGFAVKNTLAQTYEQEQLKQTIVTLQKCVKELETAEKEEKATIERQHFVETKSHEVKTNILDEIVFVFKRGEIELPTLPQMSIRFQEMVNKGINLQEIGALLKKWKFSETFVKIASYHDNLTIADSITNDLAVVHLANLMVKSMGYTANENEGDLLQEIDLEDTESARQLGLDMSMIEEYKNQVSGFMKELTGLFA